MSSTPVKKKKKRTDEPKYRRPPYCRLEFRFLGPEHLALCVKAKEKSNAKSMNAWIVQATQELAARQLGQ